jgi:hypothetical protein
MNFKQFLYEKAPLDKEIEDWITSVKPEFKEQYGDRWEEVLYAKAWKKYNEKHSNDKKKGD